LDLVGAFQIAVPCPQGDFPEFGNGELFLGGTGVSGVKGSSSVGIGTMPGGTRGVAKAPAALLSEFIDAVALMINALLCLAFA
jgi:hypothetical protein